MCLMLYMAVSLGIFLKYEKKRQLTRYELVAFLHLQIESLNEYLY